MPAKDLKSKYKVKPKSAAELQRLENELLEFLKIHPHGLGMSEILLLKKEFKESETTTRKLLHRLARRGLAVFVGYTKKGRWFPKSDDMVVSYPWRALKHFAENAAKLTPRITGGWTTILQLIDLVGENINLYAEQPFTAIKDTAAVDFTKFPAGTLVLQPRVVETIYKCDKCGASGVPRALIAGNSVIVLHAGKWTTYGWEATAYCVIEESKLEKWREELKNVRQTADSPSDTE